MVSENQDPKAEALRIDTFIKLQYAPLALWSPSSIRIITLVLKETWEQSPVPCLKTIPTHTSQFALD